MNDATRGITCTIDLNAVAANYRHLQTLAPRSEIATAVKANGYGLGALEITRTLSASGCRRFYVATYDEALELRTALPHIAIAVLGGIPPGMERDAAARSITPVLNDFAALDRWQKSGTALPAILHLDTGMNRLGFDPYDWQRFLDTPALHGGISHLLSHLACSDDAEHPMNEIQRQRFSAAADLLPQAKTSFANSHGMLLGPAYHFDQCRPGIALYGLNVPGLKQAVRLEAPILMVRSIDSNTSVGYGATQHVGKGTRLATIAAGYADGLMRALSNSDTRSRSHFYIGDYKVPLVGRVSMDLVVVDVTHVPETLAHPGALVEMVGPHQTADQLADMAGTIGYEMLTAISARVTRHYLPLAHSEAA